MALYIAGAWREGRGKEFISHNPATGEELWRGNAANENDVEEALSAARKSLPDWSKLSFEKRINVLLEYQEILQTQKNELAAIISKETGKPLWESKYEVTFMIQKISISIAAAQERCPIKNIIKGKSTLTVHHKPHGVVAVFGPFNFPGHLPNGHIVPALLAGNTIVFKGSELTPLVSQAMISYLQGLPKGVINLLQGGVSTGSHLMQHPHIDGLFFTGSYKTGLSFLKHFSTHPEKIIALEMGGNNPLIVSQISDLYAAAYLTIQSAFLTSGQRCTCARRLIVPKHDIGDAFLQVLVKMSSNIQIGPFTDFPEPFMGPVISVDSSDKLLKAQTLLEYKNGIYLLKMRRIIENTPFLSPGIMDVTYVDNRRDEELFGPFLQVIRVPTFQAAIEEANNTHYGLVASIFTDSQEEFNHFYQEVKAGVINWNMPTTGASSEAPFGGQGKSGNHRPSGYYAADYCAYPVASMHNEIICLPNELSPGISIPGNYTNLENFS